MKQLLSPLFALVVACTLLGCTTSKRTTRLLPAVHTDTRYLSSRQFDSIYIFRDRTTDYRRAIRSPESADQPFGLDNHLTDSYDRNAGSCYWPSSSYCLPSTLNHQLSGSCCLPLGSYDRNAGSYYWPSNSYCLPSALNHQLSGSCSLPLSSYDRNAGLCNRPPDTLVIHETLTEYRYRLLHDTIRIHQVDTVPVIHEVEVIQEIARPLTRFDRLTRTTFWIVIALLAAYLFRFFRRNIPRIIPRILSQIKSRLFS